METVDRLPAADAAPDGAAASDGAAARPVPRALRWLVVGLSLVAIFAVSVVLMGQWLDGSFGDLFLIPMLLMAPLVIAVVAAALGPYVLRERSWLVTFLVATIAVLAATGYLGFSDGDLVWPVLGALAVAALWLPIGAHWLVRPPVRPDR